MITLELVDKLHTSEYAELERFIAFRFPRLRVDVIELLRVLQSNGNQSLTRHEIHNLIYSGKPFDDKKIRYLLTDLNRAIFQYFSHKQLQKRESDQSIMLLRELAERECNRSFSKQYNQEQIRIQNNGSIDSNTLHHQYSMASLKAEYDIGHGQRSSETFEQSSEFLDHYFVAKKLQISAEKINLNFILKKEWTDPFLRNILEQIDKGMFDNSPYIQLYRLIIKTLTNPENESVFEQLKRRTPGLISKLSETELTDLYQYLLNYCIRRINAGRLSFQNELLEVYKMALKDGALLTDGKITQWDFKNIVTISLRTQQVDFALDFIDSYSNNLPDNHRSNAVAYNLANIHFAKGEYRAAIKQLQEVDLDDVFYRLDARSILLKCFYELDDTDALHYHATAFRSTLNRNRKISDNQRKLYLNLIKHTLSLSNAGGIPAKVNLIKKRISEKPNVADLRWLESKIAEI